MSWKSIAKYSFPDLKPSRPAGFTACKGSVVIAGADQPVALVFTGKDLRTLISIANSVSKQTKGTK